MRLPDLSSTIVALATPPGVGAIGVVRLSGSRAIIIADTIFKGKRLENQPSHTAHFGKIEAPDGRILDEVLITIFKNPHSYTGEDTAEISCHGSPYILQEIIQLCLQKGARLAEPGEFSRRAFLNGKMDLAQAEAVADLIDAATSSAARSAVRSLQGEFSRAIGELNEELINLRMLVEATLDFPDEDIDFLKAADAFGRLQRLQSKLAEIFDRAGQGKLLQSGLHVVLAGQPNVGKSSLLNRLAGDDLAIVTPIAGTTRDALRSTIQIEGIPLHIIDTAGLRETEDEVEKIGIARSWQEIERSDVVLLLVDAQAGVSAADCEILARLPARLQRVTVHNKIDLTGRSAERHDEPDTVAISLSARSGAGIDLLRRELLRIAGWHQAEDVFIARERHLRALAAAQGHVAAARNVVEGRLPALELFAEELRLAQQSLGEITGEFTADDLLGVIFSRFCIGK